MGGSPVLRTTSLLPPQPKPVPICTPWLRGASKSKVSCSKIQHAGVHGVWTHKLGIMSPELYRWATRAWYTVHIPNYAIEELFLSFLHSSLVELVKCKAIKVNIALNMLTVENIISIYFFIISCCVYHHPRAQVHTRRCHSHADMSMPSGKVQYAKNFHRLYLITQLKGYFCKFPYNSLVKLIEYPSISPNTTLTCLQGCSPKIKMAFVFGTPPHFVHFGNKITPAKFEKNWKKFRGCYWAPKFCTQSH